MKELVVLVMLCAILGAAGCKTAAYESCVPCKFDANKQKADDSVEKIATPAQNRTPVNKP